MSFSNIQSEGFLYVLRELCGVYFDRDCYQKFKLKKDPLESFYLFNGLMKREMPFE